MLESLEALISFIGTIVDFVTGFVDHIVFVCVQIAQGFAAAYMVAAHLPDVLKAIACVIIAFSLVINVIHLGD